MVMTKEALIARHVNFGTKTNYKHIQYIPHTIYYTYIALCTLMTVTIAYVQELLIITN